MKTKKCGDYGQFNYRMPNVPETMMLLGRMGLNSKSLTDTDHLQENELVYTAKMITNLEPFISEINLDFDGEKVTTYEQVLTKFEMMEYLNEVSGEIFEAINGSSKKKASRKKQ